MSIKKQSQEWLINPCKDGDIISHQGNDDGNHDKIPSHTYWDGVREQRVHIWSGSGATGCPVHSQGKCEMANTLGDCLPIS